MMGIKNVLLEGDPCAPDEHDLIAQTATVKWQETIGNTGWRILSGNNEYNYIARVAYRYEIEEEELRECYDRFGVMPVNVGERQA